MARCATVSTASLPDHSDECIGMIPHMATSSNVALTSTQLPMPGTVSSTSLRLSLPTINPPDQTPNELVDVTVAIRRKDTQVSSSHLSPPSLSTNFRPANSIVRAFRPPYSPSKNNWRKVSPESPHSLNAPDGTFSPAILSFLQPPNVNQILRSSHNSIA